MSHGGSFPAVQPPALLKPIPTSSLLLTPRSCIILPGQTSTLFKLPKCPLEVISLHTSSKGGLPNTSLTCLILSNPSCDSPQPLTHLFSLQFHLLKTSQHFWVGSSQNNHFNCSRTHSLFCAKVSAYTTPIPSYGLFGGISPSALSNPT